MRLTDLLFASERPRDEVVVHAGDDERTRGELETEADSLASVLRDVGSGARPAGRGHAAQRGRGRRRAVRCLAGGRGLRPAEPPADRRGGRGGPRRRPPGGGRHDGGSGATRPRPAGGRRERRRHLAPAGERLAGRVRCRRTRRRRRGARRRRRGDLLHVRDDGSPEAGAAAPLRRGRDDRRGDPDAAPRDRDRDRRAGPAADAEPRPRVARSVVRDLPGAVRVPRRRAGDRHARVRAGRVRVARAPVRGAVDRPAAGRDDDARRRRARHRPRAAAVRAQHHRAAVAAAGPALQGQVRDLGAQRLRPDGARRRDRRLERRRLPCVRRHEVGRGRTPAPGSRRTARRRERCRRRAR